MHILAIPIRTRTSLGLIYIFVSFQEKNRIRNLKQQPKIKNKKHLHM